MLPALFHEQPGKSDRTIVSLFEPLKNGKSVAFHVTDTRLPKKARVKDLPLLLLAPTTLFGGVPGGLVCSLQAYGCEVIDLSKRVASLHFVRLGLTSSLAIALADALNDVFHGGNNHGNRKKRSTRQTRRA